VSAELLRGFSSRLQEQKDVEQENAYFREKGLELKGLKGKAREMAQQDYYRNQGQGKNENDRLIIRDIEKKEGLPEGALSAYEGNPNLALKVHGTKETHKTQASQPIDEDQLKRIRAIEKTDKFKAAPLPKKKSMLHKGGVSKENASAVLDPYIEEEKLLEKKALREEGQIARSHESQKSFIEDTTNKFKSFETEMKPRLLQMRNIPDEDLVGPTAATFLEHLGIPLGALENPASELYHKLSLDLLKGLPETYGNRILKVEVDNFLKTIPSLMNSPDGRRMIASNMLKLGEMKEVYYNAMRREQKKSIDENKPLPKGFQQEVFDQVKPQIDRINNEFVKMSEIKSVPDGTIPFFSPSGEIEFVPKEHAQWAQENGGRRIW
jgi:hypothetical protein